MADPIYKYSVNEYPTDGTQVTFEISFADGYIDKSYVAVQLTDAAGVRTYPTFTVNGDYTLTLDAAPAAGGTLMIYRDTPADKPLVDFNDGAVINEATLDLNARQAVHLAAETRDIVGSIPQLEALQSAEAALAYATSRANHTGTQPISTVDGLASELAYLDGQVSGFGTHIAALAGDSGSQLVGYRPKRTLGILRALGDVLDDLPWSIKDLGNIFGDGATDMSARITSAIANGPKNVFFPADTGDYVLNGSIVVPTAGNMRIFGQKGHRLYQKAKYLPVIDMVGVDDMTVEQMYIAFDPATFVKDTTNSGSAYRFDQQYGLTCGIYASGNRTRLLNNRIDGAILGVSMNSFYNGGITADRVDNLIDGLYIKGGQQGVVVKGQNNLTITNLRTRDLVLPPNTSGGADDPQHSIYCTGVQTYRNSRISITNVMAQNVAGSSAIQCKYVDGLVIGDIFTDNAAAVNLFDCHGFAVSNVSATNCTDLGGQGGLVVGFGNESTAAVKSDRGSITNCRFIMAPTVTRCFGCFGDNIVTRNIVFSVPVTSDTSNTAVSISGSQNDIEAEVNFTAGFGMLACQVRSSVITTDDNDVRIRTRGARGALNTASGVTNTRFHFDPATALCKTGYVVTSADAGTDTQYKRAPHEIATTHSAAASITFPELASCTRRVFKLTDGSNYTMTQPANLVNTPDGTTMEVVVMNTSTGSLGAITWNAVWKFKSGYTAPAAGLAARYNFRYDKASGNMIET